LTVDGNASITGTVNIDNTITLDSKNEDPSHDKGVVIIQPSTSGGRTGINFRSKVNSDSDHGYLWWYDDNNNYANDGVNTENGVLVLGVQNDASSSVAKDAVAVESSGNIFLNPGLNDNNTGGTSGPDFGRGKVYIGRESTKYQVWHEGNDGPSSGLNADLLDGQEGTYYLNAGNLNAGTIPDARISGNFLKSNASDTMTGDFTLNGSLTIHTGGNNTYGQIRGYGNDNHFIAIRGIVANQSGLSISGGHQTTFVEHAVFANEGWYFKSNTTGSYREVARIDGTHQMYLGGNKVWNAGNDGSGSGLDADLLDGFQRTDVMNYNNLSNRPTIPTNNNQLTNGRGFITGVNSAAAKSGFAHNYNATTYSGTSYFSGNYGNHISASLTPSSSNNRVVVMASFSLRRGGSQSNNRYARARLAGGGDLRNIEIVQTNSGWDDFKLIAYDAAGNTSNRTYYLQINYTSTSHSNANVQIRNASIVAIELSSS